MMHQTVDKDAVAYVANRVQRAIRTLHSLPDPDRKHLYNQGSAWPEVLQSVHEAYGYTEARPPKFKPTPRDIDEMQEGLHWLLWIKQQKGGEKDYKLIMGRAFDAPYWRLAVSLRLSESQLRRRYQGAHVNIWAHFKVQHTSA